MSRLRRAVALVAVALPAALAAQGAPARDYIVGGGDVRFALRAGADQPLAQGEFFDFTTDLLTLSRRSFLAPAGEAELGWRLGTRAELVVSAGFARSSAGSEYRRLVGTDDLPIAQRTTLQRIPVAVGVRYNLRTPGRRAGSLAYVPTRGLVPWVAAGGGAMRWRLEQAGEFVFENDAIDPATFRASRWAPMAHAGGGIDWLVGTRTSVTLDARYTWARRAFPAAPQRPGTVGGFEGFDPLDLSGIAIRAGLSWRL